MAALISTDELNCMAGFAEQFMSSQATITRLPTATSDGMGGNATWASSDFATVATAVPCSIAPASARETEQARKLTDLFVWKLLFPRLTDVRMRDRLVLVISGTSHTYDIVQVITYPEYEVVRTAMAVEVA